LTDSDCPKIDEDGDLTTVVLVDKGKGGVNPRKYGGTLYDLNSMIVLAGTTSTGGSDSIELVGVQRDKGKNVDGGEENGFVTATPATTEPALAVEVLMDNDYLESYEDGDLGTVALVDKGKGVDPQEYGGALDDPKSLMIAPVGTTSTGGLDSIELVAIHRDKGKNVDPEERGNGMAKHEPGPSRINFQDDLLAKVNIQEQTTLLQFFERKRTRDLNDGHHDPTLPRPSWHPKISPYRFIMFSIPLAIGTVKAVSSQKGGVTTPITLEWVSGVVIFLV